MTQVQDTSDFRSTVRAWLEANFPASLRNKGEPSPGALTGNLTEDEKLWKERMVGQGWGTPTWPKKYGGGGLSALEARILT